jgi:hypothetical protein
VVASSIPRVGKITHFRRRTIKMKKKNNGFLDALKVIMGQDLEDEAPKKTKVTKKAEEADSPKEEKKATIKEEPKKDSRTPVASKSAVFAAYDYAADKDLLSKDVREALKTGSMSEELRKLLQVLFDKKAVRDLVAAQGDVRGPEPDYYLDFTFTNGDKDCTDAAAKMLESGVALEDLETYNIKLNVVRKRKSDDSVAGEANEEEVEKIKKQILDTLKKEG